MVRVRLCETGKHGEFASRLRSILHESGLSPTHVTYKQIGRRIGVSGTMVGYMLNGDKLPGLARAIGIASSTGVCVEWLLTGRGPKTPLVQDHSPTVCPKHQEMLEAFDQLSTKNQNLVIAIMLQLLNFEDN